MPDSAAIPSGIDGLRVLAWNIRAGGGARLDGIAAALVRHDADVLVLSEYHAGAAGERLRATLVALGYPWMTKAAPPVGRKGVLIAARRRFREFGPVDATLPEPWKLIAADFGTLRLVGVYMPNLLAKLPYWEALLAHLAPFRDGRALAVGDFNTCRAFLDEAGNTDRCAHFMDRVDALGFHDLWRRRNPERLEFSWFSHRKNGFRLDHAFLSPRLALRAGTIGYSHAEREAGLSDHSAMTIELHARGGRNSARAA